MSVRKFREERKTMPEEIAVMFVFQSDSNPNKQYQTLQYVNGTTSCECPGWKFKRPGNQRLCKHTRWVDAGLANQHAIKVTEYSVVTTKRTPQRAMPQPSFSRPSGRRLELED